MEVKRRKARYQGTDSGGRKLPELAEVVVLPQADGLPEFPADLGQAGRTMWRRIWQDGITWISPQSDLAAAEEAARLADDVEVARRRYRATSDPGDARGLVAVQKQFTESLSVLGFNPTARSRLGVAEVKRVSALDKLLERRAGG